MALLCGDLSALLLICFSAHQDDIQALSVTVLLDTVYPFGYLCKGLGISDVI
uniref:Uncharacterized protein n=1 Tax=Arcella intermedia TaxID=1963864 RepID=A0A6B2LW80_9EUKA